eukprot:Skav233294  [mRNA]  locus=scaffold1501:57120:60094:+ [translate_table: standard]
MNASWQDLPVLSQVVALRRGRPQVADVLVSITGHLKQNGTKDIPASGRVLENGDIVLVISRYDMTEMSLLEMIVVPVLPDEKFEVRWLQEEAENMDIRVEDLPIFGHCPESEILLQRYRACQNSGGTGDWNASVLRRTFSPDFQGWKYHRGSLTTTQSAYSHDGKHLQKTWQLADLFDAAVHLDKDLLPNALDVLSGIGRRAVNETQAQQQVAAEWLKRAIEVGNLPLLEALEPALPQGFVSNGETSIADTLCKEVWKVASQHSDNDSWSVNWLKEVAHLGEKWTYGGLDKWTRCLIENGIQETAAPEAGVYLFRFAKIIVLQIV